MYELLVRLMAISALTQLGISLSTLSDCRSRDCLIRLEKAARKAVEIEWKPISLFPEEAKRLQQSGRRAPQRRQ